MERINYVTEYYKEKYGARTLRICIDGGFTCPNRDGTKGLGGCIFCSEKGSGEHLSSKFSISQQIENYFSSYKVSRADNFILYFQNYTNTYDTINNLKLKYDEAIETASTLALQLNKKIVGLEIATRPDCISSEICNLLASYKSKLDVTVELGLQTSNNVTGELLNRKYTTEDFCIAVSLLNKYDIPVIAHMMVGLPNESHNDIVSTLSFLNSLSIHGLKVHSTYVVKNTKLAKLYNDKKYTPLKLEEYLNELEYIITHVRKDIVLYRISGDAPKNILVAPEWNLHKKLVLNGIYKILKEKNLTQGCLYLK